MTALHGRSRLALRRRRLRLWWLRFSQPVLGPFRARWRSSLRLRTMTITAAITAVMIFVAGVFILTSVGDDLYSSRRDQALADSARATLAAQSVLDSSNATDRARLTTLVDSVRRAVLDTSSSSMIYLRRQPGQVDVSDAPVDSNTSQALVDAVTEELSASLTDTDAPQHWQPVSLPNETGVSGPGIAVGSTLSFPSGVGNYDLFIGYNFSDTEESLNAIQRTLLITTIGLLALIISLVWVISRSVFRPIRAAADASHRLAAGDSRARMPLQNDEHFDVLSGNFNNMAETLQARITELDELSDMQQRFVSDVSHELRTPLTTIRLASEVLRGQQEAMDPSQGRAVEVLGTQIDRFETLLGDLLEISRYDAGRITLETEPTNLVALARDVIDGIQPLSKSMIELRPIGGYGTVDVDARRIRRIISNLVGNAAEHGEGRPVVVTIDSNAAAVAVTVRDWGVGLKTEDIERVFDRFWRADPARKRTFGGTGLGLAIAREDAAVHGGLLEAWSRPGEGANFRLTLPRGDASAFVSPLPLIPDDVSVEETDPGTTGGWLRRPFRRVWKERSQ
ncbi:two-component sensor histidine kinase [Leucobacter sp. Psy1]|uniref:MtrAB system histidine kinase MtrB n=1 Tax=Leucobacter sp. Psy1 TaxID=2875729 RepID=UPI001CD504FC|nr:MtrAB system histidine kinase MtrB [Leucobacter sp. Psy1]UBH04897.1 two-component sensor histidine kinase [Leucobacter sp. Psy1]